MSRIKVWAFSLLCIVFILIGCTFAQASTITASIDIDPKVLTEPGPVNVTITLSNTGDTDMTSPFTLYDPATKLVESFGDGGSCKLKAGETETWTGIYQVSQNTLNNGSITYYLKYQTLNDAGETVEDKQILRAEIKSQSSDKPITVNHFASPNIASDGQEVVITYEIINSGVDPLYDICVQENKAYKADKQEVSQLDPGKSVSLTFPVTMGKKDIESNAKITYKTEKNEKSKSYSAESITIRYGKSDLTAKVSSSSKGVVKNGTVTLNLKLINNGTLDYSDIRVSDPILGNLFVNELSGKDLSAGKSLSLDTEITVTDTATYQFMITATDETGNETTLTSDALDITAVNPEDVLSLDVIVTADHTEVFENPAKVHMTFEIANNSNVDAKNVTLMHGETKICTFESLAAGKTKKFSRDFSPSMSGKYQFTVTAKDPLENTLSFESNSLQILFSVPTPVPATPTPVPDPTPEPTFQPATIPPKSDPSIGSVPKLFQKILSPIGWIAGILLAACVCLTAIVFARKLKNKIDDSKALDTMTRSTPRDYCSDESENTAPVPEHVTVSSVDGNEARSLHRSDDDFVSRDADAGDNTDSVTLEGLAENFDSAEDIWKKWEEKDKATEVAEAQKLKEKQSEELSQELPNWARNNNQTESESVPDGDDFQTSTHVQETPRRRRATKA